jgi:3-deoxy-7-phosphoheptulonate synthase
VSTDTDDLRISSLRPLLPAAILHEELPQTEAASATVVKARQEARAILGGRDDRLLVVVGPCSIHDADAAMDYARRLREQADRFSENLVVVMRVYFEKPRTTVGWKGLINDPDLDGSFNINQGLRVARRLLLDLAEMGLPAGVEFLDAITPQFIADVIAWGAIGARTTESQIHRQLASGLSMPVGFKNGTDGSIQIAVDAVKAAASPHHFMGATKQGISAIVATRGNPTCHVILRGSSKGSNYDAKSVSDAVVVIEKSGATPRLMIDFSHGNSAKDHRRQVVVANSVAEQIETGCEHIAGVMIESNLVAGKQAYSSDKDMTYGQSITDACIGWDETIPVLERLSDAVAKRRAR